MTEVSTNDFLALLRRDGVVRSADARLTPLAGGVSCEIYVVEDGGEKFVVKRALAKLKVKADWFADVNRNRTEWEYIRYVAQFLPEAVPVVRHVSTEGNYFAMDHLGGGFTNWKQLLLSGFADADAAARAGRLLAEIHRRSAGGVEVRRVFDTTRNFFQLRIEPYLLVTGAKHPALNPLFHAEAKRLENTRECLVHGDFSPKNMLVGSDRLVILDCEVAWYGDPAFDLAFFLNHLLLKALFHAPKDTGIPAMVLQFWAAYQAARPSAEIGPRTGRLLLMLMLARVDGKSPVEYLDEERRNFVRQFIGANLTEETFSPNEIAAAWFEQLKGFQG